MAIRLSIVNGPNLNLLGVREPHIYGSTTLGAIEKSCREFATFLGIELDFSQSNHEGVMVDTIQAARGGSQALIINPAGYSFTSVALFDVMKTFEGPIIEVHISKASPPFEAVGRRDIGDLRAGTLRLHRGHAGGGAARRETARRPARANRDGTGLGARQR
jgi:3-dehydroquinate dehydratase